jgi:hypothetical protein
MASTLINVPVQKFKWSSEITVQASNQVLIFANAHIKKHFLKFILYILCI